MAISGAYKPDFITLIDPSTLTAAATATQAVVPYDVRIEDIVAAVDTAPLGSTAVIEIRNGSTVLATVTFAATTGVPSVAYSTRTIPAGAKLNLNTTAIGSGTAAVNAVIAVAVVA